MARIVVTGGSLCGLMTAAMLAGDDHEVTVLERDGAPAPEGAESPWSDWDRTGVNQFRMIHYFQPRWRQIVEAEMPGLVKEIDAVGALRFNALDGIPDSIKGGTRPDDAQFTALTGRRPVIEAALARFVASMLGVTVRRGAAVAGLLTADDSDVPHVIGVRTEDGDQVTADLVVDATGRRSPLMRWLDAAGARPAIEIEEDLGFVYYGRHFRSDDGSIPPVIGGLLQAGDSLSTLTLPCDNGTWGIGLIASSVDKELRALKGNDSWMKAVGAMPLVAHWIQGEPIDDVAVMARIPDRYRRLVVEGAPVATGVVAVGDAWACTNPSLGRGTAIGAMQVLGLRDLLRSADIGDRTGFALAFDEMTETTVGPWYRATQTSDTHRLNEISAQIEGKPYETDDPGWEITSAWQSAVSADPDLLRGFLRVVGVLASAEEVMGEPGILDKITSLGGGWRDVERVGPSRAELLSLISA